MAAAEQPHHSLEPIKAILLLGRAATGEPTTPQRTKRVSHGLEYTRCMAGTLSYSIRARHVFQRRFDSESLGKALSFCHWYIISRRPSVRIIPESVRLDDNIITLDVVTRNSVHSDRQAHHLAADLALARAAKNFEVHANGAYFSVSIGDRLIHGDAWALASLLSLARPDIARQEVLYIGHAFGKGENNAWQRTRNHEKLQRIYADHVSDDWEIFVAPLVLEKHSWSTDDHIDDTDDEPDIAAYYENFAVYGGGILKPSVDLIEHSLISYFRPHYNALLKEWRPSNPTDAMSKMRSARFRLLHVHMNGWMGLARFYSHQESEQIRSHFISHDIPPEPRRPVLRGISAPQLSEWRIDARLVEDGRAIFANLAEYSGVELDIFGDEAPAVGVPPEVVLPSTDGLRSKSTVPPDDTSTLGSLNHNEAMRVRIKEDREAPRKANEPIPHPGESSYDPSTGLITTGRYVDDRGEAAWRLHGPEASGVYHGLIIGDPQMGKSNGLWVIMLEAALSGVFLVVPADPRNEHNFPGRLRSAAPRRWDARPGRGLHHIRSLLRLTSTSQPFVDDRTWLNSKDVPETIENLRTVCRVVDARATKGGYVLPTRKKPGILFTIDDADEILRDSCGSEMVEKILVEGGQVGVGIIVVVRDLASLEGSSLIRILVSVENKQIYMHDGYYRFMNFAATHGPRRASTMSSHTVTFVLHWCETEVTLGRLLSVGDPGLTPDEAQNWSNETLGRVKDRPLTPWEMLDSDVRSWWSLDLQFFLRRHPDGWALLHNIARAPGRETQIEALKWADSVLTTRFFDVEREDWILGPTTGEPGLLALYANASSEPVTKPFPLDAYLRWQY